MGSAAVHPGVAICYIPLPSTCSYAGLMQVGVNIGGDVSKLLADFKVEVFGTEDLSDAAHGRQLRCVEGITANTECKRWSLAGVVQETVTKHLLCCLALE